MPRVYRTMRRDGEYPRVESSRLGLGSRRGFDILPEGDGGVHPGTGGMSVMSSRFPPILSLIPKRLKETDPRYAGGTASADSSIFRMGDGPFAGGAMTEGLALSPDARQAWHGSVEPRQNVSYEDYEAALAATRDLWSVEEGGDDR